MFIHRHKFFSYIKAGILLHLVTLIEIFLFITLSYSSHISTWLMKTGNVAHFFILAIFISLPVLAQLDARSRFQNYKLIKDLLFHYGFQPRILKPFMKSRCQRDAAFVAAEELGYGYECNNYFRQKGYRWYHLFPDIVFTKPLTLLSKDFWLTTFFVNTYHSRFNFIDIVKMEKVKKSSEKEIISRSFRFANSATEELPISSSAIS